MTATQVNTLAIDSNTGEYTSQRQLKKAHESQTAGVGDTTGVRDTAKFYKHPRQHSIIRPGGGGGAIVTNE